MYAPSAVAYSSHHHDTGATTASSLANDAWDILSASSSSTSDTDGFNGHHDTFPPPLFDQQGYDITPHNHHQHHQHHHHQHHINSSVASCYTGVDADTVDGVDGVAPMDTTQSHAFIQAQGHTTPTPTPTTTSATAVTAVVIPSIGVPVLTTPVIATPASTTSYHHNHYHHQQQQHQSMTPLVVAPSSSSSMYDIGVTAIATPTSTLTTNVNINGVGGITSVSATLGRTSFTRLGGGGACALCHTAKTRCDGQRPCARCVKKGDGDKCVDRPRQQPRQRRNQPTIYPFTNQQQQQPMIPLNQTMLHDVTTGVSNVTITSDIPSYGATTTPVPLPSSSIASVSDASSVVSTPMPPLSPRTIVTVQTSRGAMMMTAADSGGQGILYTIPSSTGGAYIVKDQGPSSATIATMIAKRVADVSSPAYAPTVDTITDITVAAMNAATNDGHGTAAVTMATVTPTVPSSSLWSSSVSSSHDLATGNSVPNARKRARGNSSDDDDNDHHDLSDSSTRISTAMPIQPSSTWSTQEGNGQGHTSSSSSSSSSPSEASLISNGYTDTCDGGQRGPMSVHEWGRCNRDPAICASMFKCPSNGELEKKAASVVARYAAASATAAMYSDRPDIHRDCDEEFEEAMIGLSPWFIAQVELSLTTRRIPATSSQKVCWLLANMLGTPFVQLMVKSDVIRTELDIEPSSRLPWSLAPWFMAAATATATGTGTAATDSSSPSKAKSSSLASSTYLPPMYSSVNKLRSNGQSSSTNKYTPFAFSTFPELLDDTPSKASFLQTINWTSREIAYGSSAQLEDLPLAAIAVIRDSNPHSCTPFYYHVNREYERLLGYSPRDIRFRMDPFAFRAFFRMQTLDEAISISRLFFRCMLGLETDFRMMMTIVNRWGCGMRVLLTARFDLAGVYGFRSFHFFIMPLPDGLPDIPSLSQLTHIRSTSPSTTSTSSTISY